MPTPCHLMNPRVGLVLAPHLPHREGSDPISRPVRPRPAHGLSQQALNVLITQDTVSSSRTATALAAVAQQGESASLR